MKYEKKELEKLIIEEKMSYEAIGRIYGVTGNAIKKAALRLGIKLESRRKVQSTENFIIWRTSATNSIHNLIGFEESLRSKKKNGRNFGN